jgi:putative ABC transport system permease protein
MLKHYLLLSLKVLLRRKFFTFISIVGISLTLLVLLVVTAIIDHQLAPMAPETRQDLTLVANMAVLYGDDGQGGRNQWCCNGGFALFDQHARHLPGAAALSIFSNRRTVFSYLDGRKIESQMKRTDAEFWTILQFTFLEGRPFTAAEVNGADMVAVINRATREKFFGEGSAAGRALDADGRRFRVVGVVENVSMIRDVPYSDIWVPYTTAKNNSWKTGLMGEFAAIVLASNKAALPGIRHEFNARLAGISRSAFPDPRNYDAIVAPFETKFDSLARDVGPFVDQTDPDPQGWRVALAFSALATFFVLLPTVNLVNINVSRIMERASEIGIRKAFGASSRTLVGQFIVENVILTMAGGLVGLVLTAFVLRALNGSGLIPYSELAVNWRVFVYGLLLAALFGVISGVYPAWRMSRLHPAQALTGGRR